MPGAANAPLPVRAAKPSLALIGAGYWGKNLARNFAELGDLRAICDADERLLAGFRERDPALRVVTDVAAVLADPSITRVAIAAPAALHFTLAKRALEAGKDVFVEKPLCLTVA